MRWERIGECCGTAVIIGFGEFNVENFDKLLLNLYDTRYNRYYPIDNYHEKNPDSGILIQANLTTRQKKIWHKALKERGFKITAKWKNINSKKLIYRYEKITDGIRKI